MGFATPVGLRRYYDKGDWHFITFSCHRRLPLLKTVRARNIFVKELERVRDEMGFRLPTLGVGFICENADVSSSDRCERVRREGQPKTQV